MDVLACLSCGRRYAVDREGALGGTRCTNCSGELEVVSRGVSQMRLLGHRRPSSGRSHTANGDTHSASDVDAEIAALAKVARQAGRA
jgi:DNA-directed RNA polymerase subunit RPC12/RpoP